MVMVANQDSALLFEKPCSFALFLIFIRMKLGSSFTTPAFLFFFPFCTVFYSYVCLLSFNFNFASICFALVICFRWPIMLMFYVEKFLSIWTARHCQYEGGMEFVFVKRCLAVPLFCCLSCCSAASLSLVLSYSLKSGELSYLGGTWFWVASASLMIIIPTYTLSILVHTSWWGLCTVKLGKRLEWKWESVPTYLFFYLGFFVLLYGSKLYYCLVG